jgi:hypothetical protein
MSPPEPTRTLPAAASSHGQPNPESQRVKVINHTRNGPQAVRRRAADHYVAEGRAVWIGPGMIRLHESHPKNIAMRERAESWHEGSDISRSGERVFGAKPDSTKRHRITPNHRKLRSRTELGPAGSVRSVFFGVVTQTT